VAAMLMFTEVSNFLSQRLLAYVPALPAFMAGSMSFRAYVAASELTTELISGASWFTNVMTEIAVLRANAARLTALAAAVERVRDRDRFYAQTGRSAFRRHDILTGPMLTLDELELCHRGHDAIPFVRLPRLELHRGDRLHVSGPSGCGKSSLLKAVAGLWPYGGGQIGVAAGARVFARLLLQEPDIVLLDESTSALDAKAAADFHVALDERLPDTVVLSVLHTSVAPVDPSGRPFYTQTLVLTPSIALTTAVAARPEPAPFPQLAPAAALTAQ